MTEILLVSMLIRYQYGFIKRVEHFWKGMSNNKSQISPIPPEPYGDRFVSFISGLTKPKEEQRREDDSGEQGDGSIRQSASWPASRKSHEKKVVEKAERQAERSEKDGATEEPQRDRAIGTIRSPSAERSSGTHGATLPVVEEDGEASREDVSASATIGRGPPVSLPRKDGETDDTRLPSIPNFNRLSMGLTSTTPAEGPGH